MSVTTMKAKYLIIGNSAGGVGAAEAIREVDLSGTLAIVSEEPYPAYSRPLISEHLAEGCTLERMLYRPADFYQKNNLQTYLGSRVVHLDTTSHTVELDKGEKIAWERLLLATGGIPIVPPLEGKGLPGVFTFTTLEDAKAISRYIGDKSRAVVIGGGLIGVSVSEALVERGIYVTIVEMKEHLLNVLLDEEASIMEEEALRKAGVTLVTGHTVAKVNGTGRAESVTLDYGGELPADLVVLAIGVRPRLELAAGTEIKVNRGILVDSRMSTSVPDVYACGDVAEAFDYIYRERRLTPIWPNAYLGGRVAGFNMAGVTAEYQGGTALNSVRYFGQEVASAGMVAPAGEGYQVISRRKNGNYRRLVLRDGGIVGLVLVGNIERAGILHGLMKYKTNVAGFKEALVADDFSLAALPKEVWRPRLEGVLR